MDRLPLSAWLSQIEKNIRGRRLFPDRSRILVAVSGGVDSMVLLCALRNLARSHRWKLRVAHFNHQLRGLAADADERLVRQVARALKLPIIVGRGDVAGEAAGSGISVEMAARRLRHQFLARAAVRLRIPVIALAHHADDQVELFFVRLLRGAGGQGLGGMQWSNPSPANPAITLVRPLLDQSKETLTEIARAASIRYSEDATNASLDIVRNRIRNELLPLLVKHYQPRLARAVLRMMDLTGAEASVVTDLAKAWLADPAGAAFDKLALATQRRIIQLQLHQGGATPDFDLVERLRLKPNQPFALNDHQTVSRAEAGLLRWQEVPAFSFDPARRQIELSGKQGRIRFAGKTIAWKLIARRGTGAEYFDADRLGASILLRHWQPGDRFHPIGAADACKVQDLFTNLKVSRAERHRRIVAATAEGRIFWVEGLRMSEPFKVTPSTRRILEWKPLCSPVKPTPS